MPLYIRLPALLFLLKQFIKEQLCFVEVIVTVHYHLLNDTSRVFMLWHNTTKITLQRAKNVVCTIFVQSILTEDRFRKSLFNQKAQGMPCKQADKHMDSLKTWDQFDKPQSMNTEGQSQPI